MIKIDTILGNISSPRWQQLAAGAQLEHISLDQWMAQRCRFVALSDQGEEYAFRLERNTRLSDGDVVAWDEVAKRMTIIRLRLNDLLVVDLGTLARQPIDTALRTAVELGHAIGNQHWAAVIRGTKVYVPMVVDKKVMESVMRTHHLEHIFYSFRPAQQIIPYLSPHEVRRLLGSIAEVEHHHHICNEC